MKESSIVRFVIFASLCFLLFIGVVNAGNEELREISQDFLYKKWTSDEGLPQNTVTSIVQTRDGYIWIGTFGGLARFDGIKFTMMDSVNWPELTSNRILSLKEDSRRSLWVGTDDGKVFSFTDGRFIAFGVADGFERGPVWALQEDNDGNMLIASDGGIESVRIDDQYGSEARMPNILARGASYGLCVDELGVIWGRVGRDAILISKNKISSANALGINVPEDFLRCSNGIGGRVYLTSNKVVGFVKSGSFSPLKRLDYIAHRAAISLTSEGNALWFQEPGMLTHFRDDHVIRYSLKALVDGGTRTMLFDREGNLWLGTNGEGLVRLTKRKLGLLSELINIRDDAYYSIANSSDGSVWIGGTSLIRVSEKKAVRIERTADGMTFPPIRSIAVDKDDRIWVGGELGISLLSGEQLIQQDKLYDEDIYAMFFDRTNTLWVGGKNGLWNEVNGEFVHYSTADGLADNRVSCIRQMRDGAIWVGTRSGVSVFRSGRLENISAELGISGSYVRELVEDNEGTIWIGTYGGGIYRLKAGVVKNISSANGLRDNFVSRIIEDRDERFWILGNLGIMSVARNELNLVADGAKSTFFGTVFDRSDGMPSAEANGGAQTVGAISQNGELWFPITRDVVIIDPVKFRQEPRDAIIERAFSHRGANVTEQGRRGLSIPATVRLENGTRNIEIEYTVLSFTNPEKARFYVKMEGLEDEWTDVGARRTASYPYLPAGDFVFLVKAVAPDGTISEVPAMLRISVEAYYWETWWFRTLAIIAAIVLIICIFRVRVGQLKAQQAQQKAFSARLIEAHESERERIAKDLHDGLGQNLLMINNLARAGVAADPRSDEQRLKLRQISNIVAETINETREMIGDLSPKNLRRFGLAASIRNMIKNVERATSVAFEAEIDEIDAIFPPQAELMIYRIVQEALNNIIKHSDSPRGRVVISKLSDAVALEVSDVGNGFDVEEALDPAGRYSGSGLQNMVQRVRMTGGQIDIESRVGEGTNIKIRFPRN
ncbi:MAG: hypothetical protein K1X36_03340 [Pyrinomonadaceae bacterium]|nr:hypothetical protein [Pyrinomonadaceae bacterium]